MTFDINTQHIGTLRIQTNSSLIEWMEYHPQSLKLEVHYKRGPRKHTTRTYRDISMGMFMSLLSGPSLGKALLKMLHQKEKSYNSLIEEN
ncbi:hypothetical protein [Marinoscillum furvescens]|uniref:hypothetical protein n=1 Tax=Marinoscillum furvescens TaxID=1026 RepID=UPI0011C0829A|nr:hypothetical protein [Marinoscillum furvescens]